MALLWSKKTRHTDYQVRSAGNTVRLYTNGVFHSQYNPLNPFNGALWDCLSLPSLLLGAPAALPAAPAILVLGAGGGAVIKQLHVLFESPQVTAIDLDATHLSVAKRWFGVDARRDKLVHANARDWLEEYQGDGFDLIIDDLFGEENGEPVRAVTLDKDWVQLLVDNLKPAGMIIANCVNRSELHASKLVGHKAFCSQFRIEHPLYENSIGLFVAADVPVCHWQQAIATHSALNTAQRRRALALRIRKIEVSN